MSRGWNEAFWTFSAVALAAGGGLALAQENDAGPPRLADAQACYAGQVTRCAPAGDAYHEGTGGVEPSAAMAIELYRFGCEHDDARSCRGLGWMHHRGDGVAADLGAAHRFYLRSCEGGYALACFDLGTLHWTGEGVPESRDEGRAYYERACSMRHADACREVAFLHGRGLGVPRDEARMVELLRQACELGSEVACVEASDPSAAVERAGGVVDAGAPDAGADAGVDAGVAQTPSPPSR